MRKHFWRAALARLLSKQARRAATRPARKPRLKVEQLEDRVTPTISLFQEGVDSGFGVYNSTQDTRLIEGDETNRAADPLIWVDFTGGDANSEILLRFDNIIGTGPGQIPAGALITSATLALTTDGDANSPGDGGGFYRMTTPWNESTTWNTTSSGFGVVPTLDAREKFEAQAGFPSLSPNVERGRHDYDVTADVKGWVSGETHLGWAFLPWENGTDGWGIQSSESTTPTNRPALRVEWFQPNATTAAVTFQTGVDMGIGSAQPDTPIGPTAPTLTVVSGATTQALLRFDNLFGTGAGQIPANILGARLRLTTAGSPFGSKTDPAAGSGAATHRLLTPFTAASTWNSFGGNGVQANGIEAFATADDSVGFNEGGPQIVAGQNVYLDVAESVRAWADGSTNHGFALLPFANGNNDWIFNSLNSASDAPVLEVIYSTTVQLARIIVEPQGTSTSENGTTVTIQVRLDAPPTANVTVPVSVSDPTEASVSVASLTFTTTNFAQAQTVTVTGLNDLLVDGDISYEVRFGPATSTDTNYNGRSGGPVVLTNTDNDTTGLFLRDFQEGVNGYTGQADIELNQASPATPFPVGRNGTALLVDFTDAGADNAGQALVRFANLFGSGPGQIPLGATIVSAELILTTNNTGDGGTLHRLLTPFDAVNDTWNSWGNGTAPRNSTAAVQADDAEARAPFDSQIGTASVAGASGTGALSIGVTTDLQAWSSGAANQGWAIIPWPGGTNGWAFQSSETSVVRERPLLTVFFIPGNRPPNAVDDSFAVNQDTSNNSLNVLANDTDPDTGDTLTVDSVTQPASGTVQITGNGAQVGFTPSAGFIGTVTFTYTVKDSGGLTDTATVTVSVNAVGNTPPNAVDDTATVNEDAPATAINVLANDTDANNHTLTITAVTQPTNGQVAITGGGSGLTFQPNPNFNGTATFTYTISDGNGGTDTATVAVTVSGAAVSPPVVSTSATPLAYAENAGAVVIDNALTVTDSDPASLTGATVAITGGYVNGQDVLGFVTQGGITGTFNATTGVLTLTGNASVAAYETALRSVTYSNGSDAPSTAARTVAFQVNDGTALSNTATRAINVTAVNDAPVANNDSYTVAEDNTLTVNAVTGVLANDTDVEGNTLTAALVSGPSNGALKLNSDGSFIYTPNVNFSGIDSFTYSANDGNGGTSQATVTINVLAAPKVESVVINDRFAQRSMVTSLTVTFDQQVTLAAGAFTLLNNGSPVGVVINVAVTVVNGRTVATLTFSGNGIVGGSLADGLYTLTIDADKVTNSTGGTMLVDRQESFHRLFGYTDGNNTVDNTDLTLFRSALNSARHMANYLWNLDYDADGDVDYLDYFWFRRNQARPS